jgi:hypothetical protein
LPTCIRRATDRRPGTGGGGGRALGELVLACLVTDGAFLLQGLVFVPSLLVPALAVDAVALLRPWPTPGR